jgi:hypothetical protein
MIGVGLEYLSVAILWLIVIFLCMFIVGILIILRLYSKNIATNGIFYDNSAWDEIGIAALVCFVIFLAYFYSDQPLFSQRIILENMALLLAIYSLLLFIIPCVRWLIIVTESIFDVLFPTSGYWLSKWFPTVAAEHSFINQFIYSSSIKKELISFSLIGFGWLTIWMICVTLDLSRKYILLFVAFSLSPLLVVYEFHCLLTVWQCTNNINLLWNGLIALTLVILILISLAHFQLECPERISIITGVVIIVLIPANFYFIGFMKFVLLVFWCLLIFSTINVVIGLPAFFLTLIAVGDGIMEGHNM